MPDRSISRHNPFSLAHVFLVVALFLPPGSFLYQPTPPPSGTDISTPIQSSSVIAAPEYTGCGGAYPSSVNSDYEQLVVELVNTERASNGLPPLKRVALLDQAARYHVRDMQQDNYFDHKSYDRVDGNLSFVCNFDERINYFYKNWNWLGENMALGYSSPLSAMAGWMDSSGHRDNILGSQYREIGVGYYTGNYWVQDFGTRPNVYPIIINGESAKTETTDVTIYIHGSASYWTEMRLRNDALDWSGWSPFQNTISWQLPNLGGEHTVWVELRRGSITTSSSDTIYLNKSTPAQLGNLPEKLTFTYSTADQRFSPNRFNLQPLNIGGGSTFDWEILSSGNWFGVSPGVGSIPDTFTITPIGTFTKSGVTYFGLVTVDVTSPDGAIGSPHDIEVSLSVIDYPFKEIYLPFIVAPP